jgi:hypothetical protein
VAKASLKVHSLTALRHIGTADESMRALVRGPGFESAFVLGVGSISGTWRISLYLTMALHMWAPSVVSLSGRFPEKGGAEGLPVPRLPCVQ